MINLNLALKRYFQGTDVFYYDDCLSEEYLVTSSQTAFSVALLWEWTTLMIVNKCSFEELAASYNLFHNEGRSDDGRATLEPKRLRGTYFHLFVSLWGGLASALYVILYKNT